MKNKWIIVLAACLLSVPKLTLAQNGISKSVLKKLNDNSTVYVNTKAPGVHKEYDEKHGGYVWKNGMGNYICLDKNMKPIHEIDKDDYFDGVNGDPNTPTASSPTVKKVWDKERNCYVWRNVTTGDYLGHDKPSADQQQKWLDEKNGKWLSNGNIPKGKAPQKPSPELKKDKGMDWEEPKNESWNDYDDGDDLDRLVITNDEEMREMETLLNEIKQELAEAKAEGLDMSNYGFEEYVKKLEKAINEYKRRRR